MHAQVQFSRDGNFLYTGARRDADIFCWDVRYAADVVYRLQREAAGTNQRIHFDIEPCGRHLASGAPALHFIACAALVLLVQGPAASWACPGACGGCCRQGCRMTVEQA